VILKSTRTSARDLTILSILKLFKVLLMLFKEIVKKLAKTLKTSSYMTIRKKWKKSKYWLLDRE
jgi:hypothetical protein